WITFCPPRCSMNTLPIEVSVWHNCTTRQRTVSAGFSLAIESLAHRTGRFKVSQGFLQDQLSCGLFMIHVGGGVLLQTITA
ncbi:hypothetical protein T265_12314, partial [Opisthorchis viverrini]